MILLLGKSAMFLDKTSINAGARCLVLGGRGFIGSHLVSALLDRGFKVRCFDRPHVETIGIEHLNHPCFELYEGDFVSEADIAGAVEGCDVCFHLVSTTLPKSSNADPVFDVESNVVGTIRLLNQVVKNNVRKVIFLSSGGTVYGIPSITPIPESHSLDPICSYGIAKLAIEKYLGLFNVLHGVDYVVLRLSNPFGEGQRVLANQGAVAVFLGKALQGGIVDIWGDGGVVRDYVYIADVVDALVSSIYYSGGERVFNIGSGFGLSINQIIDGIEVVTGLPVRRRYLPGRNFDVPVSVLSIDRAREGLGWFPQWGFEQGLARFAQWAKSSLQ